MLASLWQFHFGSVASYHKASITFEKSSTPTNICSGKLFNLGLSVLDPRIAGHTLCGGFVSQTQMASHQITPEEIGLKKTYPITVHLRISLHVEDI